MSNDKSITATAQTRYVPVWDAILRFGHWALVAAFAIAYLSAEEEGGIRPLHVWGGYAVGIIVALRVVWGFLGPQHARFADFICGPAAAMRYLVDLMAGRTRRYLGHSPAGGAMVIALLIFLSATVITGLIAYGVRGKGPLAGAETTVATVAYADAKAAESEAISEGPKENEGSVIGGLHAAFANITLALVVLHIVGVGWASIIHRENLIVAMINGRKRADL